MSDTKEKIIERLNSIIEEGEKLKSEVNSYKDPKIKMWEMRATTLLERIGGEELVRKFVAVGSFSIRRGMSDKEWLDYKIKAIEGRTNFLIVKKEDLELFSEEDEPQIKKIRDKFEAGIDLGLIKGKVSRERERDKK